VFFALRAPTKWASRVGLWRRREEAEWAGPPIGAMVREDDLRDGARRKGPATRPFATVIMAGLESIARKERRWGSSHWAHPVLRIA
jgi:hypothetical protein